MKWHKHSKNRLYLKDKNKDKTISEEILHNENLLSLVNEAAVRLLTIDSDSFDVVLTEIMKKIGTYLNVDSVFIWKNNEQDGIPVYTILHGWYSATVDKKNIFESILGTTSIPRAPDWDNRLLGEKGYLSELSKNFQDPIRSILFTSGIQAMMGFPVFFQGNFWGFVSFENRHSEELCSESEAAILQSASLLLANAIERNDNTLQLTERLAQQQLMSDISKSFITKESMDNLIRNALAHMGTFMKADRIIIGVFEKKSEISRPAYFWFADPKYTPTSSQKGFSAIIRNLFPQFHNDNDDNPSIYCNNTLTYKDERFKIFYEQVGVKSLICVPIYVEGELWGVMSVEIHKEFRHWSESDAILVSTVCSSISNAVIRDIIEKERTEALDKAVQASRAKGDFLANMSHEIRTPMNAIIGMTSIGKSSNTIEKKDYAFDKIDSASKHLLGVINDILDMSKIEANKLELSDINFEFERMLQKVVNVINFRVDELRQKFYINIDSNMPRSFIGDDLRLAQVITNLLSNAVKFTPEEGVIHLNAKFISEKDSMCCLQISVEDTGIGITDEQKSHLFTSFGQAETGTSRKFGGTGLGLSISKHIVELMGGKIWLESEPGKGSIFTFTVTLKRGLDNQKNLLSSGVNWNNIHILAVDDEPEIRQFFKDISNNLGISCDVAASGEEVINNLNPESHYDIYFIDWKLPGIDGLELAKYISKKQSRQSAIIILSSTDWNIIEDEARAAGLNKFMPKPLFQSSVVDAINDCIGVQQTAKLEPVKNNESYNDFSNYTILLVEDVEINREIILTLLEPSHINIDCAENGLQALEMFKNTPDKYDLIFMDIQMPEMDGYEATQYIRGLDIPKAEEIPIIAMTANAFSEDIERCITTGMNTHVSKPIDLDEVLDIMKKYLIYKGE